MADRWTADVIGELHIARISKKRLAEEIGITPEYLSMILNGHRAPDGAEQKIRDAISRIKTTVDKLLSEPEGGE